MHLAYKCDICNQSFDTEQEALEHEDEHKLIKKIKESLPSKFNIGDIVKLKIMPTLFIIQDKNVSKNLVTGIYEWKYTLYDRYNYDATGANDDGLELIVSCNKVKDLVADINELLKKYNKNLYVDEEVIFSDDDPVLELIYRNEKC